MGRRTVYNGFLTKEWDQVSEANKEFVSAFISYCRSNDKSPQTIKQYNEWLKVFFCWNYRSNHDKLFVECRKRDFVNYLGYLRGLGLSSNRISSLKSALSSLSNEIELLYDDEYPHFKNQLRGLTPIKISPVRDKTVLSTEDVEEILDSLLQAKEYQIACWFALLCSSGCRRAEALQMKVSFFREENEILGGYMYKTPKIRAKGAGKTGKMIEKYVIKPFFKKYLDLWLEERRRLGVELDSLFVYITEDGIRESNVNCASYFAKMITKIYGKPYYNHCARHYFCTLLKSMKLPDDIIVEIFQWSDSSMVKVYDDTPVDAKLNQWFDANGVKTPKNGD